VCREAPSEGRRRLTSAFSALRITRVACSRVNVYCATFGKITELLAYSPRLIGKTRIWTGSSVLQGRYARIAFLDVPRLLAGGHQAKALRPVKGQIRVSTRNRRQGHHNGGYQLPSRRDKTKNAVPASSITLPLVVKCSLKRASRRVAGQEKISESWHAPN